MNWGLSLYLRWLSTLVFSKLSRFFKEWPLGGWLYLIGLLDARSLLGLLLDFLKGWSLVGWLYLVGLFVFGVGRLWSRGAVELWSCGAVELRSCGSVEPWSCWAVEPWALGCC